MRVDARHRGRRRARETNFEAGQPACSTLAALPRANRSESGLGLFFCQGGVEQWRSHGNEREPDARFRLRQRVAELPGPEAGKLFNYMYPPPLGMPQTNWRSDPRMVLVSQGRGHGEDLSLDGQAFTVVRHYNSGTAATQGMRLIRSEASRRDPTVGLENRLRPRAHRT